MNHAGRWVVLLSSVLCWIALPGSAPASGPRLDKEEIARPQTPPDPDEAAEPDARQRALDNGWPDTSAGIMANSWVEALSAGQEAMQQFLEANLNEESLRNRSMEDRLAAASKLHAQVGDLILSKVVESEPTQLTADLLSEAGETHRFVFELTDGEPQKLVRISMMHPGAHGGHGGHSRSQ